MVGRRSHSRTLWQHAGCLSQRLLVPHAAAVRPTHCSFQGDDHARYMEAAKLVEDVPFYQTTDLAVAKQVGITKPGFVLTRNYPGKYPGSYGEAAFLTRPVRPAPGIRYAA